MSDIVRSSSEAGQQAGSTALLLTFRWLWVAVPLAWGTLETVRTSLAFFR
jgi:hypothetical protein